MIDGLNDLGYQNEIEELIVHEKKYKKWIKCSNLLIFLDKCGSLPVYAHEINRIQRYIYLKEQVLNIIHELEEDQLFYFATFHKCFTDRKILKNILQFL